MNRPYNLIRLRVLSVSAVQSPNPGPQESLQSPILLLLAAPQVVEETAFLHLVEIAAVD